MMQVCGKVLFKCDKLSGVLRDSLQTPQTAGLIYTPIAALIVQCTGLNSIEPCGGSNCN